MSRSIVIGLLVTATVLLPLAAAGSENYTANQLGLPFHFVISGTATSVPTLSQTSGTAVIIDAVFNPVTGMWSGDIKCLLPVGGSCTGTVSS